ncbi:MAG: hypothetical protein UV38_C0003G0149 [candidate division TM6 bacterium GW2011_GWE2_42_60]|nr:MAG: hypothetical protein UV38_C0003G0149 [candidate division TM6 bacterium GW2011_GWE2_42_60]HBY05374.1 hypothetical protein [Candidatus Dependentiae bacterium]
MNKFRIIAGLLLCLAPALVSASSTEPKEEIKEVSAQMSEKEAQNRLIALVWLLCAQEDKTKKAAAINEAQKIYQDLTNESLKKQLKLIVQAFPTNALELLKKYLANSFSIKLFEDSDDYIVSTSSVIRELLEAGCDPMILLNNSYFFTKAYPSEDSIKNRSYGSSYWGDSEPSDNNVKRHLELFAKHRPIVIQALSNSVKILLPTIIKTSDENKFVEIRNHLSRINFTEEECQNFLKIPTTSEMIKRWLPYVIPTQENKKQWELTEKWRNLTDINNIKTTREFWGKNKESKGFNALFEQLKQCVEEGLNLNQILALTWGVLEETPLTLAIQNQYLTDEDRLVLIQYLLDKGARLDYVSPFAISSQLHTVACVCSREIFKFLLKKGAQLDKDAKKRAEQRYGKGCCEKMLKEPLMSATEKIPAKMHLLTLLHYKQKLESEKTKPQFNFDPNELKNNSVPKKLAPFYEKMTEIKIDNELKAWVETYPDAAESILNNDPKWDGTYCPFQDKGNSYNITIKHRALFTWLLQAGTSPFALLNHPNLWEHLTNLKYNHTLSTLATLTDKSLYTHLLKAIKENDLELAKKALKHYPHRIYITRTQIKFALLTVTSSTNPELIKLLKNEPQKRRLEAIDEVWQNLKYFSANAKKNNKVYISNNPLVPQFKNGSFVQVAHWCLLNGLDPHTSTRTRTTPLGEIVCCGLNFALGTEPTEDEVISIIELLLKYKIDLNAKGLDGRTALECAIAANRYKVCTFLVKNGAQITDKAKILLQEHGRTEAFEKIQPVGVGTPRGHWYRNPWIWTGIACGAGLAAAWGVYTYMHKKPFIPAAFTRTILQLKKRLAPRFSAALTHSRRPNGLLRVSGES